VVASDNPILDTLMRYALLLAAAAGFAACGTSSTDLPAGTGILRVQLTDAPFPADTVASVDIWVVRVDARPSEADSGQAAAGASDDSASTGGWATIARPNRSYDLMSLRNGTVADIGQDTLPQGTYRGFRLIIDPSQSSITLKDGTVLDGDQISFPSAARTGLKVNPTQAIPVGADSTSTVLVDFDLDQSFVMRGHSISQGLLFKPVIRASPKTSP
jgi:hypothetical protein